MSSSPSHNVQVDEQIIGQIPADIEDRIRQTRLDIAALRHPNAPNDRFDSAKAELSTVTEATEAASNSIFGYAERVEEIAGGLLDSCKNEADRAKLQEIVDTVTNVYEALGFQDLTGQRMNKVRETIEFVENSVSSLMATWGQDEIAQLPVPGDEPGEADTSLLNGPRSEGEAGVDQADIDALFD